MTCGEDFFYDKITDGCLPCKDPCDPNRGTRPLAECNILCSGYLQRTRTSQTTKDHLHMSSSNSERVTASVLIVMIVIVLTAIAAVVTAAACYKRRIRNAKRNYLEASELTPGTRASLEESQRKERSVSLCGDRRSSILSHGKTVSLLSRNDSYARDTLFSSSQETQCRNDYAKTPVKVMYASDSVQSTRLKQEPIQTAVTIDLQEDGYDFVEQAYEVPLEGNDDDVVVVGDHPSSSADRINYRITASLQRLPWIKQFWWDSEGAKIAVDESHLENGKEKIKEILRQVGIPSQDFSFEIIRSLVVT